MFLTCLTACTASLYNGDSWNSLRILNITQVGWNQASISYQKKSTLPRGDVVFLAIRSSSVVSAPQEGQSYSVGQTLGSSKVVYFGKKDVFLDADLEMGTNYNYALYSALESQLNYKLIANTDFIARPQRFSYSEGGLGRDGFYHNGYFYAAENTRGFSIYNVSNPSSPTKVFHADTLGFCEALAVSNGYLYVADSIEGLLVYQVSNPISAVHITTKSLTSIIRGMKISGSYLYATFKESLVVFDIEKPWVPKVVASLPATCTDCGRIEKNGNFVWMADTNNLILVNVSSPTAPTYVTSYDYSGLLRGPLEDLVIVGTKAYILLRNYAINVLDITNPGTAVSLGTYYGLSGSCNRVIVQEPYLYTTCDIHLLGYVIAAHDITSPSTISVVDNLILPYDSTGAALAVDANYLFASFGVEFGVYNISNPSSITPISQTYRYSFYEQQAYGLVENTLVTFNKDLGFRLADISQGGSSRHLGAFSFPTCQPVGMFSTTTIKTSGTNLYVTQGGTGLCIISLDDLSNPQLLNVVSDANIVNTVIKGDYAFSIAYTMFGQLWLNTIDISNPSSATIQNSYFVGPGGGEKLAIFENHLVLIQNSTLKIFDISNPLSPVLLSTLSVPNGVLDFALKGQYIIIYNANNNIEVASWSDPSNPFLISTWQDLNSVSNIHLHENHLYISRSYPNENSLLVYDVSNPLSPKTVYTHSEIFKILSFNYLSNYLFIEGEYNGLDLYKYFP